MTRSDFRSRIRNGILSVFFLPMLGAPDAYCTTEVHENAYRDPLNVPAVLSARAMKTPLLDVTIAGKRLVAVGQQGRIVVSDDKGVTWRQVAVPVSTDLTAVTFATGQDGWAVGHDGVILHTKDGGLTWEKQLDGWQASRLIEDFYQAHASDDESVQAAIKESKGIASTAPSMSFLDVWFKNRQEGFVVGAFNLILKTNDGGVTWEPWYHRTDNPDYYHLSAITGIGDEVYIAGERGLVMKLDPAQQKFVAMSVPYKGSFFGVTMSRAVVVVYGLRGTAFVSHDHGASWQPSETGVQQALTGGVVTDKGEVVLTSLRGDLLRSDDQGATFSSVNTGRYRTLYGIVVTGESLVLTGQDGVQVDVVKPK
ncbi:WD40/YVTN/BNR-like repeat-containing protein [Pseudomonas sp. NFX224]|uniref:WD40/YVTN/BNR-like repeat-containing protein n=1 Tax=Pseudomonas sp. NFX224 TaxID=3402862 RepID=UPI003AFAE3B2